MCEREGKKIDTLKVIFHTEQALKGYPIATRAFFYGKKTFGDQNTLATETP